MTPRWPIRRAFPDAAGSRCGRATSAAIKAIWNPLVREWDERTFYDFIASSDAPFAGSSFRHREVFGQVGFGTGGWDSDFPNSMLEILRVNVARAAMTTSVWSWAASEQVLRRLWRQRPTCAHWPAGTSLASLNGGATAARRHSPSAARARWRAQRDRPMGHEREVYDAVSGDLPDPSADHRDRRGGAALLARSSGWRSTARATCSRPRPSSWSTGRSGTTSIRLPAGRCCR